MPAPWIDIDLDKPRRIRFRHNDLADLELAAGKGVVELVSGQSLHGIRMLLCYGLRWSDSKMTPQKAGELIDGWMQAGNGLDTLFDRVLEALRASGYLKPTPEAQEKNAAAEAETTASS